MFEELRESFLFVRNRADEQGGLELQNFVYRIHVPAIAELWQAVYRSDVGAPFCDAYKSFFRADGAEDRGCARRERNDAQGVRRRKRHRKSVANVVRRGVIRAAFCAPTRAGSYRWIISCRKRRRAWCRYAVRRDSPSNTRRKAFSRAKFHRASRHRRVYRLSSPLRYSRCYECRRADSH